MASFYDYSVIAGNGEEIKRTAQDAEKCRFYTIPLTREFRPDLIAWDLYNDVSMADYIAFLNDIQDTPEGFYRGRKIRVLKEEYRDLVC